MLLSSQIKLGIFIPCQIPSLLCHILLIYHLISNPQLRRAIHNHIILVFLVINFFLITIDLSLTYYFLFNGGITQNPVEFCLAWNFVDSFLSISSVLLMTWASFERHLIIFYDRQVYSNKFKRFIFHYIPITCIIIYTLIFYSIAVYVHPRCSNDHIFDFDKFLCDRACYVHHDKIISSMDLLLHKILCSLLIFTFNSLLLFRIFYEKRQRNQIIRWRRHKRMTIQMLSISTLYLIGILPNAISESLHVYGGERFDNELSAVQEELFLYLFFLVSLIIPFVCLLSLPEIYVKLHFLPFFKRPQNVVSHITETHRPNQNGITLLNVQRMNADSTLRL